MGVIIGHFIILMVLIFFLFSRELNNIMIKGESEVMQLSSNNNSNRCNNNNSNNNNKRITVSNSIIIKINLWEITRLKMPAKMWIKLIGIWKEAYFFVYSYLLKETFINKNAKIKFTDK